MIRLLKSFFTLQYDHAEYDVRIKAVILMYFSVILLLFFPGLMVSNLLKGDYAVTKPLLILPADMAVIAAGIVFLRRGRYQTVVNIYIATMLASFIAYMILDTFYGIMSLYHVNTFYYAFIIIVFAALFGGWRWLIALPLLLSAFSITYFTMLGGYLHISSRILKGVLVDMCFALVLVSSLSILIKKVNGSVIGKVEEYNRRLRREMEERISLERRMLGISEAVRERIGQDLHDDLGQHLVAIKMRSEMLRDRLRGRSSASSKEIYRLVELSEEAIAKTRRIAQGLGAGRLDTESLAASLNRLALDSGDLYGITCSLRCAGAAVADDLTAANLYRIAQESITNAVRHGGARRIRIELAADGRGISLAVESDGAPFREPEAENQGLGITLMRYRADLIGAELTIGPGDTGGTVVRCLREQREEES